MTELFTATVRGIPNVLVSKGTYKWHSVQEIEADKQIFPNGYFTDHNDSDLTDLQPMRLVKADAVEVLIRNIEASIELCEANAKLQKETGILATAVEYRVAANTLKNWLPAIQHLFAQLPESPSAGGEGECIFVENDEKPSPNDVYQRSCKNSGHEWSKLNEKNRCIWCGAVPKPTPSVTIELTENTVGNALTDENLLFVAQFLDRYTVGRGGYEATVLRAISTLILTKLTPRMEEPKEFGTRVMAASNCSEEVIEWRLILWGGENEWMTLMGNALCLCDWSDLINPRIIGGDTK